MARYTVTKPHGGRAVGDKVELTRRQAEFLVLGGFVEKMAETHTLPAPDPKPPRKPKKESTK
jgi:hypothetical protein